MAENAGSGVATSGTRRQLRQQIRGWHERVRLNVILPSLIIVGVMFTSIFAPLLTLYDPEAIDLSIRLQPPQWQKGGSSAHVLGTDTLGRDVLARVLYGGRASLQVAVYVIAVGGAIGLALAMVAGYVRGLPGALIMRLVDTMLALPSILIALVFAVSLQPSMATVVIALTMVIWARFTRVLQGEVVSVSANIYVTQARVFGASKLRIMMVHILPNILNTFLVLLSLNIGWAILVEASLSFLGAGIPPPAPSWGQMVAEGRGYIATAWWISFFPGLILAATVLSTNLLGDWTRDRLDPRLRQL